ncbi:MAG: hypothetical protein MPW15_07845 [Candidatus Manganitrophus sp.]|nr:hypothetical protein [Candidatus Manganitrophus sp.]
MARRREIRNRLFAYLVLIIGVGVFTFGSSQQALAQLGAIGGIGGISGGDTNEASPLFTMTGSPSFNEGEGSLSFAYQNTRITRILGDKIEDRSVELFGANVDAELTSKVFLISYGVTDLLSVGAVFEFDTSRVRATDPTTGAVSKAEQEDLANPSFSVKYTVLRNPNISIRGTVKLPTGFEAGSDNPEVDLDLAYSVSLWGYSDLHLQVGYQYTFEDRFNFDPTDILVANAALARSFGENFTFFTELTYRQGGGSFDSENDSPTQKSLDVVPGFKAQFQEKFLFSTAARIAIINDFELGYDYSYLALFSYIF